jgi:hypothetical protein
MPTFSPRLRRPDRVPIALSETNGQNWSAGAKRWADGDISRCLPQTRQISRQISGSMPGLVWTSRTTALSSRRKRGAEPAGHHVLDAIFALAVLDDFHRAEVLAHKIVDPVLKFAIDAI